eukprot:3941924-Rhodomonas_salina.3
MVLGDVRYEHRVWRYAIWSTELAYGAQCILHGQGRTSRRDGICLLDGPVMSGTDIAYGAM